MPTRSIRFQRSMSNNSSSSTHLERTDGSLRKSAVNYCIVREIKDISPTVKLLKLETENIAFAAGQWVDFMIPETDLVGGYSICSAPDSNKFELAVKYSEQPPAKWVHTKCKAGQHVRVRVGGDVYLHPQRDNYKLVVLIAGGIGISPLFSMLQAASTDTKYHLIYSAATFEELIFREEIAELSAKHANISAQFHLTQQHSYPEWLHSSMTIQLGRIKPDDVNRIIDSYRNRIDDEEMICFICGPPVMIDSFANRVAIKVHYEKWW